MLNSQLTALIRVADRGSLSQAAKKLYLSPVAVTKWLNALE